MNKIRILLVEDDLFWQENLARDLKKTPDLELMHIAASAEESLSGVKQFQPDVVLMDIHLADNRMSGLDAAKEIVKFSDCRIIILTSSQEDEVIQEAFENGAVNYLTKMSIADLTQAIRDAYSGRSTIHSDAAGSLLTGFRQAKKEFKLSVLTKEERHVFDLREQGMNRSQIAENLHKSVYTVKNQLRKIREKLGK